METFVIKHGNLITTTLSCFDRILLKGYLPLPHGKAMAAFLDGQNVLLKDFGAFAQKQQEQLKAHAQQLAAATGPPLQYLSGRQRKEALADTIARRDGARLDRLARNLAFIANLMEGGVDFIAVDMPQATRLTIHILAAAAEHEGEMISKRTRAALAEARRRGTRLGNPRIEEARRAALQALRANRPAPEVVALMAGWRRQEWSLRRIADELNRLNLRPPRGRQWYASSVRNQLDGKLL